MKAIIYQSAAGHTQRYASLLSEAINIPAYDLFEARKHLLKGDDVFFMGWIRGRDLMGYGFFLKRYAVKAIGIVGTSPTGEKALNTVRKHYRTKDIPLFYLQGGINNRKIRGSDRKVLEMLKDDLAKKATRKRKKNLPLSAEEELLLKALVNDADYVCKENLEQIMRWFNAENQEFPKL